MKNVLKQLGKAICYYVLFLGMQYVVMFAYMLIYAFMASLKMADAGMFDALALTEKITYSVLQQTNMITIISGCLTLFALWIFFLIRKKKLYREVNVAAISGKQAACIIVLGIALATVVCAGLTLLPETWLNAYAEQSQYMVGDSVIIMVISNMIVAPVVEEVVVRGLMLSRLKKAMPTVWAVIISSLLFGLAHGQILWITYAALLGVILAVVALKSDSLLGSILLHITFNVFGTVVPLVFAGVTSTAATVLIFVVGVVISAVSLFGFLKLAVTVQP